jgi:hypothetical protein
MNCTRDHLLLEPFLFQMCSSGAEGMVLSRKVQPLVRPVSSSPGPRKWKISLSARPCIASLDKRRPSASYMGMGVRCVVSREVSVKKVLMSEHGVVGGSSARQDVASSAVGTSDVGRCENRKRRIPRFMRHIKR